VVCGGEQFGQQGNWREAASQFAQAQAITQIWPQVAPEDAVRLQLGLAQIALQTGDWATARTTLTEAQTILAQRRLVWWLAAWGYYRGMLLAVEENFVAAREAYEQALTAVAHGSNPDYKPLLLLNLAELAPTKTSEQQYLARCLQAAQERARELDRAHCLHVGQLLQG
jgi:tetratricopeptide (TPR) repeat protein